MNNTTATGQDVNLRKVEANSYNAAVGDKRPPTAYEVSVDGVVIGTVFTVSSASYRLHGARKHRGSLIGYPRSWRCKLLGASDGDYFNSASTRSLAIYLLVLKAQA